MCSESLQGMNTCYKDILNGSKALNSQHDPMNYEMEIDAQRSD